MCTGQKSQVRLSALPWDFCVVENYSTICTDWVSTAVAQNVTASHAVQCSVRRANLCQFSIVTNLGRFLFVAAMLDVISRTSESETSSWLVSTGPRWLLEPRYRYVRTRFFCVSFSFFQILSCADFEGGSCTLLTTGREIVIKKNDHLLCEIRISY